MSAVHEESEPEKDRPDRPRTLLIRHLPSHLPIAEREDLIRFFGAKAVRCMSDFSSMKYSAFAVFDTPDQATHALQELHQLEVLGSKLTVQYSTKEFLHDAPTKLKIPKPPSESEKKCKVDIEELEPIVPEDIDHLAPYHKIEYPLNPKLMYSYPAPTVEILTNIANALASVPKFYVQVLHLMNKMNLPAPFGPVTQCPPLPSGVPEPAVDELLRVSSTESELESDDDDDKKDKVVPGAKRPSTGRKRVLKRHKLQKIISAPKTGKTLKRHEVFEKPPADTESVKPKDVSKESVDKPIFADDSTDVKKFITLQELEKHRLSSRRMKRTPLFKDYEPGSPNSTVTVTNLHKDVPEATITFVFGRYINWENVSERACYSVNLDRESRSCTICFPSEDIAELALQETNGFKLMGEYMVVKFVPKPMRETACEVVEAEKMEEEKRVEGVDDEAASAIHAAFSVPADSTPPHTGRAATPEMTGGATPERATPEMADELVPEMNQVVMDVTEEEPSTSVKSDDMKHESKLSDSQSNDGEIVDEEPLVDYEDSRYISKSELEKGRISTEKMSHFKVFNNYNPGELSDRLYIKNLNPKQIQESEFVWLFGSFLRDRNRDAAEQLEIKIMKEGRMKGQAFVTFPSPSEADKALRASNGYVLHGKPMVIVFGKK